MQDASDKRIALYWHNGRSLGHIVRSATLGQGLLEHMPGSAVMGITGASKGFELLPPGMDVYHHTWLLTTRWELFPRPLCPLRETIY